jgi:flagellar motility protein MotE (MotC chaperone)
MAMIPSKVAAPAAVKQEGSATARIVPVVSGPSWNFQNPDLEQLVADLKKEKEALAKREAQLNELAARLESERKEINSVTQTVAQVQRDLDQSLTRIKEEESANLKKLAKLYSSMSPDASVLILKQMDDTALMRILLFMKDTEVAQTLENLGKQGPAEAARVAALTERLRLSVKPSPKKTP